MADKSITLKILATGDQALRTVRQVTGDIDKSLKQSEIGLTTYGRAWQRAQSIARVGGLAMAAGFTAAAGAIAVAVNSAIDEADRFNELSTQLGIGTEKLSAYAYAAKLSATDIETLNPALQRLTKSMAAAMDDSSRQAQLFKAIGVSAVDASGQMRALDSVVEDVAEVFKTLPDGPEKTALALELLGKQGAGAIEFFNNGKDGLRELTDEATAFGLIVSKDTAVAAAAFNDQLDQLTFAGKGFAMQLAQEALPHLNAFTEDLVDVVRDGALAREAVDGITSSITGMIQTVRGAASSWDEFRNSGFGWFVGQLNEGATRINPVTRIAQDVQASFRNRGRAEGQSEEDQGNALRELGDIAIGVYGRMQEEVTKLTQANKDSAASTDDVREGLRRYLAERDAASKAERAHAESIKARERDEQLAHREAMKRQDEAVRMVERMVEEQERMEDAWAQTDARFKQQEQDLLNEIHLLSLSTHERERAIISMEAERLARDETGVVVEEQRRRYEELLTTLADAQRMADVAREYEGIWLDSMDGLGDALTTALFDGAESGADAIKNVMENLARDLVQFWLRQNIVVPIQQQLFGGAAGAAGAASGMGGYIGAAGLGLLLGNSQASRAGGALGAAGGYWAGSLGATMATQAVAAGSLGTTLGAALGSAAPIVGTIIGAIIGRTLGGLFDGSSDPRFRVADRESDARASSRLDDIIGVARDNMESGSATALANGIRDFDNAIADFLNNDELARVRDVLDNWTIDVSGSAATIENVLGQRFSAIMATFPADVQAFVNGATTVEERVQRLAEALSWDDQIDAILGGLRRERDLAGMDEMARQTFLVNEQFDALAEQMRNMHATEAQLAELETFRTQALGRLVIVEATAVENTTDLADAEAELIAARSEAIANLEQMMFGIRRENAGLSEFAQAMLDAGDWRADAIRSANEHARAAGLAGAREGDLADIELRAAQMRAQAIAVARSGLQDALVGAGYIDAPDTLDSLNARIAELQGGATNAASAFTAAGDAIGQAVDTMREQMALLLGDLSPFNDNRKLEIAREGLQAGSVSQEQFLQIARRLFGSTDSYLREFEFAQQFPNRAQEMGGGGFNVSGSSTFSAGGGDGRTLDQLIEARDALLAANRVTNAQDIARRMAELSAASGETFDELASSMGFSLERLAADLSFTDQQLRDYLQSISDTFTEDQFMLGANAITAAIQFSTDAIVAAITGRDFNGIKPGSDFRYKPDVPNAADYYKPDDSGAPGKPVPFVDDGGKRIALGPAVSVSGSSDEIATLRADMAAMRAALDTSNALLAAIMGNTGSTAESGAATVSGLADVAGGLRSVARATEDNGAKQGMMP